jgi:hypothetical protein
VIVALIIGTTLAACGLAFVLMPLLSDPSSPATARHRTTVPRRIPRRADGLPDEEELGITAVDVLREIEFDRATGKLSDSDYGTLKSTYTARALEELRATREADTASVTARPSACPICDAPVAEDALYCIKCAHYLTGACPACHGPVSLPAARHCSWCGAALRAEMAESSE